MFENVWKKNWLEAQAHHEAWWNHTGLVLSSWGPGLMSDKRHADIPEPVHPETDEEKQTNIKYVAENIRWKMSRRGWPGDILPSSWPHVGTLPLASYLGASAHYSPNNIWYEPCMPDLRSPPPFKFDPEAPYVKLLEAIVAETVRLSQGNYFVGMPALLGGLDILSELRGTSEMLIEMLDDPEGLKIRLQEIQDAYEPAFDRMYDLIKLPDGSMCYGYFNLHGKGKVALCQCDCAIMFSPDMFAEFVVPYLRQQCAYLDRSMFHIDGSQCLSHLDHLMAIDDLDAIEYTPDPKVPGAHDPMWFPYYKRILEGGKSIWVANLLKNQVLPVLDAVGGKGVYISVNGINDKDGEELAKAVEPYRK